MLVNLVGLNKLGGPTPAFFEDTIEVVQHELETAGFACKRSLNSLDSECLNLIWGVGTDFYCFPFEEIYRNCSTENCVIFNMENLISNSPLVTQEYIQLLRHYYVFDYNQANVDFLNTPGHKSKAYEFPIMPTNRFVENFRTLDFTLKPVFDLAFFGAINERRKRIIDDITSQGVHVQIINAFGAELAQELLKCKAVLNIHFYDPGLFEIARCLIPFALGIPVISEKSVMPAGVNWIDSGAVFGNPDELPGLCSEIVGSSDILARLSRRVKEFTFDKVLGGELRDLMIHVVDQLKISP